MRHVIIIVALLFAITLRGEAEPASLVILKNEHLFITDGSADRYLQIDNDQRPKFKLRWDAWRQSLSYLVFPESEELARIVIMNVHDGTVTEFPIRPRTDPPRGFMQVVQDLSWLPNGRVRLFGSMDPRNCEEFDLDLDTKVESHVGYGSCSGIQNAPDESHIASLSTIFQGTAADTEFQVLWLDNRDLYTGAQDASSEMLIPAGPVWSPDSSMIAILEKTAATGEEAVTIVDLRGHFTRTPVSLPIGDGDAPDLEWVSGNVVVGSTGVGQIVIEAVTGKLRSVTSDVSDELARRAAAKNIRKAHDKQIRALVDKLGGTEYVELTAPPGK